MALVTWPKIRVGIDFDFDNEIDWGGLDDISSYVVSCDWNLGFGNGENKLPDEGTAKIVVRNTIPEGEFYRPFSPADEISPYSGRLKSNLLVEIQLYDENNTTWVSMWKGWTDKTIPSPMGTKGDSTTTFECVQGLMRLNNDDSFKYSIELDFPYAHEMISRIFELTEWRAPGQTESARVGFIELDTTILTDGLASVGTIDNGFRRYINIGADWGGPDGMRQALSDIVEAEQGFLIVERNGKISFRNNRWMANVVDAGGTVPLTTNSDLSDLGYIYDDQTTNVFEVAYYPNNLGSAKELWRGTETIPSGESINFLARATRDDGSSYTVQGITEITIEALTPNGNNAISEVFYSYEVRPEGVEFTVSNNHIQDVEFSITVTGLVNEKVNASSYTYVNDNKISDLGHRIRTRFDNTLIPTRHAAKRFSENENTMTPENAAGRFTHMSISLKDYDALEDLLALTIGTWVTVSDEQVDETIWAVILGESFSWTPNRLENSFILGRYRAGGTLGTIGTVTLD